MEKSSLIQVYIEAKSKDELIIEMFKNNQLHSCFFRYSTPQKEGKKWVCWYYIDILKYKLRLKNGVN